MVEEQPQNAAHSSGLIRFKHICVCSHWRLQQQLARIPRTGAYTDGRARTHAHAHTLEHCFCPTHSLHSIPTSLYLSSVLHANELSVLMPEHYHRVCLISLLPFLFPGDYPVFKQNRPSSLRSAPLPASQPAGRSDSQHSNLSSQHHYHLNVPSDMTAEQGPNLLFALVCVCVCVN